MRKCLSDPLYLAIKNIHEHAPVDRGMFISRNMMNVSCTTILLIGDRKMENRVIEK
jgi:hypothetical protein